LIEATSLTNATTIVRREVVLAAAIHECLHNGTMPCDGPWPADRIDVFQRWMNSDKVR
jgi:hypothetical protein